MRALQASGLRPLCISSRSTRAVRSPLQHVAKPFGPATPRQMDALQPVRSSGGKQDTTVSDTVVPDESGLIGGKSLYARIVDGLTVLFPVWVLVGATIGIVRPETVTWFSKDMFTMGLSFLMLSMGLTLTWKDFQECFKNPVPIGVGYLCQYGLKPILGTIIAKVLNLEPALATGLILVSCCPGGQASNVATYIANGNVALSVLMTTASTVGAIVMTPFLTKVLAGTLVSVDAWAMAREIFQVVLVPTFAGVLANEYVPSVTKRIKAVLPLVGVFLTTILCASPVGQVSAILKTNGAMLIGPVAVFHAAAFTLGYGICRYGLGFTEKTSRTVSIETGMQSAALGFLLAKTYFDDPLVCVPSAVSVVFMALGGSGLAVYWRGRPTPKEEDGKV